MKSKPLQSFLDAVRADHRSLEDFQGRYPSDRTSAGSLVAAGIERIGFQMLIAVRLMHLLRDLRIPFAKQFVCRLIRHLYGAEIHWDAQIAPGITLVHGNGLVVAHTAKIGPGCLIFQGVTLGESFSSATGTVGSPVLGRNVHVMPNAVLIGPISVGDNTKIMSGVTLTESVEANCVVKSAVPEILHRSPNETKPPGHLESEKATLS